MKYLYIHVGAGKTGTSSIQKFLFLNKSIFYNNNFDLLDNYTSKKEEISHHRLAGGQSRDINSAYNLWKEISKNKAEKILVSSEFFHSLISEENGIRLCESIKSLFEDRKIKIIFYIRDHVQWLQSAYNQWVKKDLLSKTFKDFSSSYWKNQPDQILLFSQIFGKENIIVRPYEQIQLFKKNIFSDFCRILDLPLNEKFQLPKGSNNPRLSSDALEYKRIFNSICTKKEDSNLLFNELIKYTLEFDKNADEIFCPYSNIDKDTYDYLASAVSEKYKIIAKDFLNRDSGQLFFEENFQESKKLNFSIEDLVRISSFLHIRLLKKMNKIEQQQNEILKAKLSSV